MSDYSRALQELKKRYTKGQVSALIGSGFSKNVSSLFPLWNELLKDIIDELYCEDYRCKPRFQRKRQKRIREKQLRQIIQNDGYLNIIERYIARKGFREAIEVYIEDHIPKVNLKNNSLIFKGETVQLTDEDWQVHSQLLSGNWKNIYTTNYDSLLESAVIRDGKSWRTVKSAQDLAIDSMPSIIKLHGSLHEEGDLDFSFDGKHHHRYIVSDSDYKNYPIEHEAFTQLMRISLLQDTFCIIGFSGDDPNFMSWIEWVRNVLVPTCCNLNEKEAEFYRIFLILISDRPLSRDKVLFYDNHRIASVSLRNTEVLKLIHGDNDDSDRLLLQKFLNFLYANQEEEESGNVWQRLSESFVHNTYKDIRSDFLREIKPKEWGLVSDFYYQSFVLSRINKLEKLDDIDIEIASRILLQLPLFLDSYDNIKEAFRISNNTKARKLLNYIEQIKQPRADTKIAPITYENILNFAFNLDFKSLHLALKRWNTIGIDEYRKSVLLSLFYEEQRNAINTLKKIINQAQNARERLYAAEFLDYLDWSNRNWSKRFKNQGIKGTDDFCRNLNSKFGRERIKIKAFDTDAKGISESIEIEKKEAIPILYSLINFPLLNTRLRFKRINDSVWFPIFKSCFENYPFPCLFLSSFITDEKELLRIGQEFCYSEYLHEHGIDIRILTTMLSAVSSPETPDEITCSLLWMAAPLLDSIDPKIWQPYIEPILSRDYSKYFRYPLHGSALWNFVAGALKNCGNNEISQKLLVYLLKNKNQYQNGFNQRALDKCFQQFEFIENVGTVIPELDNELDVFIKNISSREDFSIVLHIGGFFSDQQLTEIAEKIPMILREDSSEFYSWRALLWVSRKVNQYHSEIKEALINSKYLWGLDDLNKGEILPKYICLSWLKPEIVWTEQELLEIFGKLRECLKNLTHRMEASDSLDHKNLFNVDYRFLLDEMYRFTRMYSSSLSSLRIFNEFENELIQYLKKARGYSSLIDGMTSKDNRIFLSVLNELNFLLISNNLSVKYVQLLINRILLEVPEDFVLCLDMLKQFCKKNKSIPLDVINNIELVLQKLDLNKLRQLEVNIPKASSILISIAETLSQLDSKSTGVNYWLTVKNHRRFHWQTNF